MKTTISNESRAVIFGRYVGQMVLINSNGHLVYLTGNQILYASLGAHMASYLLLTPLSKISEEDAKCIVMLYESGCRIKNLIASNNAIIAFQRKNTYSYSSPITINLTNDHLPFKIHQYLQLKGYATPHTVIENGEVITYSVDELVKLGVFKLKED